MGPMLAPWTLLAGSMPLTLSVCSFLPHTPHPLWGMFEYIVEVDVSVDAADFTLGFKHAVRRLLPAPWVHILTTRGSGLANLIPTVFVQNGLKNTKTSIWLFLRGQQKPTACTLLKHSFHIVFPINKIRLSITRWSCLYYWKLSTGSKFMLRWPQVPLFQTWVNFSPSTDKLLHSL